MRSRPRRRSASSKVKKNGGWPAAVRLPAARSISCLHRTAGNEAGIDIERCRRIAAMRSAPSGWALTIGNREARPLKAFASLAADRTGRKICGRHAKIPGDTSLLGRGRLPSMLPSYIKDLNEIGVPGPAAAGNSDLWSGEVTGAGRNPRMLAGIFVFCRDRWCIEQKHCKRRTCLVSAPVRVRSCNFLLGGDAKWKHSFGVWRYFSQSARG